MQNFATKNPGFHDSGKTDIPDGNAGWAGNRQGKKLIVFLKQRLCSAF